MHMGQLFDEKMKTRLGRVQVHVHQNLDLYVAGAVGLTAGLYLGRKIGVVQVHRATAKLAAEMVGSDDTLYVFNPLQHKLWQAMYDYAEERAADLKIPVDMVLENLTYDYLGAWTRK